MTPHNGKVALQPIAAQGELSTKLAWLTAGIFVLIHIVYSSYFVDHLANTIAAWYVSFIVAV